MISLILIFTVFWSFIFYKHNAAGDFSYLSPAELVSRFDIPRIWQERISEGLGQNTLAILWGWPQDLLYGFLGKLGLPFSVIQILLFVLPFVFAGYYSIRKFLTYFGVKGWGVEVGSLLYLLNSYILLIIDGGQFSIALAYAILPLVFVLFSESVGGDLRKKLLAAVSVCCLGFLDIRYVYILALTLIVYFLFLMFTSKPSGYIKLILNWIYTGLVTFVVAVFLNAYWLIPSFLLGPPALPEGYSSVSQTLELSFANWKHALLLLHPNWYLNVFGKVTAIDKWFLLVPLTAAAGIFVSGKHKAGWFLAALAVIGIILVKGTTTPFPGVYSFLFENIPGFVMFRDPTKFYIFIALSYAYATGKLIEYAAAIKSHKYRIFPAIFMIYLLFLIRPVFMGQMTGTLSMPYNESEFARVRTELAADSNFGRVLWLPSQPPLGYSSPQHPSVEMSRIFKKRPFASGTVGAYETNNFLREAPYMGELFDISGIGYIVYPFPDTRRENLKPDNVEYYLSFLDQIASLPWIEKKITDHPVPLLKTKEHRDRFFLTDNTFLVVGSDLIYSDLIKVPGFKLKNNALVFAEQTPGVTNTLMEEQPFPVLLYDKSDIDLVSSMLPAGKFVFPSKSLPTSPGANGWWQRGSADFLWFRDFLQTKYALDLTDFDYGGGYAVSEGNNKLEVKDEKLKSGELLMARVMRSSKGGSIKFSQNGKQVGESASTVFDCPEKKLIKLTGYGDIPDKLFEYDCAELVWLSVGPLGEGGVLTVETEGEINVVNNLVSVNLEDLRDTRPPGDLNVIDLWEQPQETLESTFRTRDNPPEVSYTRVSPTEYRLKVSGLVKPSTLVFSETYDENWLLNGKKPYKVYSLYNGYMLSQGGEFRLYYQPQAFVNYGSIVSLVSAFLLLIYLVRKKALKANN